MAEQEITNCVSKDSIIRLLIVKLNGRKAAFRASSLGTFCYHQLVLLTCPGFSHYSSCKTLKHRHSATARRRNPFEVSNCLSSFDNFNDIPQGTCFHKKSRSPNCLGKSWSETSWSEKFISSLFYTFPKFG